MAGKSPVKASDAQLAELRELSKSDTTPELEGKIIAISPSSVSDEKTGATFYRAAVTLSASELRKLGDKKLISGMPVEGFIATEQRTVLTYLTKPITDNLIHVFREE